MNFRCHLAENLKLLNPTALEVDDAFFLATHSPVQIGRMRGANLNPQAATPFDESELLAAFRDPAAPFAFAIVRGTTGSGKSHLIRWVYSRLNSAPPPDTHLFLIPRSGANLRQIIERIIRGMTGPFFDEIRTELARGQEKLTSKGLRESLLDTLAMHVDPAAFVDRADPLEGLRGEARDVREYLVGGLPDLFRDRRFRRQFAETGNIVHELVNLTIGSGGASREARDRPRQFTEADFKLTESLTPEDLRGAATDEALQFAVDLNQNAELRQEAARYVNSCLPAAIQGLLDLRGSNFTDVFRKVRRQIGPKGQLIVLIEDIAAFEFLDRQLLEALIEQPDGELCPLKSAVGVTDGYFEKIDSTHIERATHLLTLDVRAGEPENRVLEFAAKYLNAIRTPLPVLVDRAKTGEPPANACTTCDYRPGCHADFGIAGEQGNGLFPFNRTALLAMQKATHGTHAGEFNPRAFLDAVIRSTLDDQAPAYAEGKFPSLAYRKQFGPPTTTGARAEALKKKYREQFEQVQVVQELWGEATPGILESFGVAPAAVEVPGEAAPAEAKKDVPKPEPKYPKWLTDSLKALDAWYGGSEMWSEPRDTIRRILRSAMLSAIDWPMEFLDEAEWAALFDPGSINFEGQARILARPLALNVARTQSGKPDIPSALAIQGLLLAHHHRGWDYEYEGQEGTAFLQISTTFLRRLAGQLLKTIREFPGKGRAWDPLPAAVETLAVAALVQGNIDESDSIDAWLNALFELRQWGPNPVGPPGTSFEKLAEGFARGGSDQGEEALLRHVRTAVGLTPSGSPFLADAGALLPVLARIRGGDRLPAETVPPEVQGPWSCVRELRRSIEQHLRPAIEEELDILSEWRQQLDASFGSLRTAEIVARSMAFLMRAETLKVYRGTASSKAGAAEIRDMLRDLKNNPIDDLRNDVAAILELSREDFAEGRGRIDRVLPRAARLRHDLIEASSEFRLALLMVIERTEAQLDRAAAAMKSDEFDQGDAEIGDALNKLVAAYEQLLPKPPEATP